VVGLVSLEGETVCVEIHCDAHSLFREKQTFLNKHIILKVFIREEVVE